MKLIIGIVLALSSATHWATRAAGEPPAKPIVLCFKKELYTVNIDGTHWKQLTNKRVPGHAPTCKNPSITNHGKEIIYTYDPEFHGGMSLFSVDIDGNNERRITAKPRNKNAGTWDASASPSGDKAVFAAKRNGNWEIYSINADGSNLLNLSQNPKDQESPKFSPDGNKVVYIETETRAIKVMNADGTSKKQITPKEVNAIVPAWSPDGHSIAYMRTVKEKYSKQRHEIWVISAEGKNNRKVTDRVSKWTTIGWGPDSKQLIFVDDNEYLSRVALDGSHRKRISDKKGVYEPAWY